MSNQSRMLELRQALSRVIVGQNILLDRLVVGLLAGGHVLVEGVPGLAKTTAVKTLAAAIHGSFRRIQFTPDLLPGDLTGTDIYHEGQFEFVEGPLFHDIVLADEINRAPAKVQAALLEAMQEHQITVGGVTRPLPPLFMVMATQNPLEQAGTYPLPEAQLDRFLLHVALDYPSDAEELDILRRDRAHAASVGHAPVMAVVDTATVLAAREEVQKVHVSDEVERYIVTLVRATRVPGEWRTDWAQAVDVGASPRAALALLHASAAAAYLRGRDYVTPDDVRELAADCLRHRIMLSLDARLLKLGRDAFIAGLLEAVPAP
ncbi:MoxR family ATPase [Thiobacillus sp.]|uniref:AAA family ATPase n=1 Tax=Thiobacillus sp. TaxID=924 RepID=UPI0017EAC555|nr:MoxR family ATPase [Thiobacillus sp.]MBC2731834.1 MoxR family ATPase [Thiobacillus sp.]MBC2740572.1 MoxR family ATPase [Thiobacillus sp.]MBC2758576.1 MoxR family ATPase [Thiobacillus sp.]